MNTKFKFLSTLILIGEWVCFGFLILVALLFLSPYLPTKRYVYSDIVVSGSMEPAIPKGSLVFLHPIRKDRVKTGDIIAFASPKDSSKTILHRVQGFRKIQNELFVLTKGDANRVADPWVVPQFALQGEYLYQVPLFGYVASFVRTKLGFALLIVLPALILMYLQIRQIYEGMKEMAERKVRNKIEQEKKSHGAQMFILFLLMGTGLCVFTLRPVYALWSDSVKVQGIRISVRSISPTPRPDERHDDDNDEHHPDDKEDHDDRDGHHQHEDRSPEKHKPRLDARYDKAHKSCWFNLSSLPRHTKIEYEVRYRSHGVEKGIHGQGESDSDTFRRDGLLIGTCSGEDCSFDDDVQNIHVTAHLSSDEGEETIEQSIGD